MATASWNHSIQYLDIRDSPEERTAIVTLAARSYGLDSLGYLIAITMRARRVAVFDVRKLTTPFEDQYLELKHQSRYVASWYDDLTQVMSCVGCTVSVHYWQPSRPD